MSNGAISVQHIRSKGIFPTSGRDFFVLNAALQNNREIISASTSLPNDLFPATKGFVRGKVFLNGFHIKKLPNNEALVHIILTEDYHDHSI